MCMPLNRSAMVSEGWQHMVAGLQLWSGYRAKEECKEKAEGKTEGESSAFKPESLTNVKLTVQREKYLKRNRSEDVA